MDVEVWHERGCGRIGETTDGIRVTMDLGDGWWRHQDCRCPLAGTSPPGQDRPVTIEDWASPTTMLRTPSKLYRHVEHPRFAEVDAQIERERLDGWLAGIMAIPDPATRAAVADSLTAHLIRYGEVP